MKKIRGILVDTREGIVPIKLEFNNFEDIANLIKCECVTCVSRNIGGVLVDVWCDEEALLRQAREPAIITRDRQSKRIVEVLFGSCFLCLHDKKGNLKSLTYSHYNTILLTQAHITNTTRTYEVLQAEM